MKDLLNIWQIYFDKKSESTCYPEYNHYDNSEKLTEYFENTVIVDLVKKGEHKKADYFGVWSHDIKADLVFTENQLRFTPENLEKVINQNKNVQVFSFQKRRDNPNIILQAERYHKGFVTIIKHILNETGFLPDIPHKLESIILFNHFIAKSEIYEQYVNELLIPAMNIMKEIPEIWEDSKYHLLKPGDHRISHFEKAFGKPYYPYHPFICERLPSLFMQKYKYNFKQIF